MKRIVRLISWITDRGTREREMEAELRAHVEMRAEDLARRGMEPREALRQARLEFGGMEKTKEECREAKGVNVVDSLWRDLRFGIRMLGKNPGFTVIAAATLALGIGANTAIFSMVNSLLFHPYSFHELDRLVRVWEERGEQASFDSRYMAAADAEDFRNAGIFETLSTYTDKSFNAAIGGETQAILGGRVSSSFFDMLGVKPFRGRVFLSEEQETGRETVAVISYGLWQRRFGGEEAALGKTLQLNGRPYTIVGIMGKEFDFPVPVELWVPLALAPAERADRAELAVEALGRLKAGVSVGQARAKLTSVSRKLEEIYPKSNGGRTAQLLQLRKELYTFTVPLFSLLQAAAVLVLLLACANLANLVFVRMIARQRELALRRALGATGARLAQLFVCEAVVLSVVAGVMAMAASLWSVKALRTSIPVNWTKWVPGWASIQVDGAVLGFGMMLALVVGVVFGLTAVAQGGRIDVNQTLKETGGASGGRSKWRMRDILAVAQVVFAMVLLTSAWITMQGFSRLAKVYAGFEPAEVVRFEISLPDKAYEKSATISEFYRRLLNQTSVLPGVERAALITNPPASNVDSERTQFSIDGQAVLKAEEMPEADLQTASADYFATLRIPLVAGRFLAESDTADAPGVVVISQGAATKYWPNGGALGHAVKLGATGSGGREVRIVGVAGDVRQNWWNGVNRPVIYQSYAQAPQRALTLLLRGPHAEQEVREVRRVVAGIDPLVALRGINTLEEEIAESIAIVRVMGTLMSVFGGVALLLAMLGVYGVLAENVAQRTREIGVRLALGATAGSMKRMVLGRALRLTCSGLAIAIPVSIAVGRAMTGLLFGIVRVDFVVVTLLGLGFVGIAVLAAYWPARRATRVEPMVALRWE